MSIDEDRLPSRPLRNWFLAWHIHTGDPPEVIAKGFDLEEQIVAELLSKDAPLMLSRNVAMELCRQLRLDPRPHWANRLLDPSWATESTERAVEALARAIR